IAPYPIDPGGTRPTCTARGSRSRERPAPHRTLGFAPHRRLGRSSEVLRGLVAPSPLPGPRRSIPRRTGTPRDPAGPRGRTAATAGHRSRGHRLARLAQDRFVGLLDLFILRPRPDERIPQAAQRGPPFLGLPEDPDVHHQVLERPTLVEVAEDQIEF